MAEHNKHMTYEQSLHAVQSGVAFEQGREPGKNNLKHLRTGLNARASDQAGLVSLLIAKGVFTKEEYLEAIRLAMIEEVDRYEAHLSAKFDADINLG